MLRIIAITCFAIGILIQGPNLLRAQTIELVSPNTSFSLLPYDLLEESVTVRNLTNDPIQLVIKRSVNDTAPGHITYFCVKDFDCYPYWVDESDVVSLDAGATVDGFLVHYIETSGVGNTAVRYTFEIVGSAETHVLDLQYQAGTTSRAAAQSPCQFGLAPNPATHSTTLQMTAAPEQPTELRILNLTGQVLQSQLLPAGLTQVNIATAELPAGMYTIMLLQPGVLPTSQRLVVAN
jgi:hypothetical protein